MTLRTMAWSLALLVMTTREARRRFFVALGAGVLLRRGLTFLSRTGVDGGVWPGVAGLSRGELRGSRGGVFGDLARAIIDCSWVVVVE